MKVSRGKGTFFLISGVFFILMSTTFGAIRRLDYPDIGGSDGRGLLPTTLMASEDLLVWDSQSNPALFERGVPGGNDILGGGDLLDEDDLLDRKFDDDCEEYDVELISAEEGGEIEVRDNEIEVPDDALDEDTWMALYVPRSSFIEYWVYPPSLTFHDTVEVTLSYQFADLMLVNEENISVVQWIPQLQGWQNVGGAVDTTADEVAVKITSFPPPGNNFSRYALADHN